jgi:glutathione S-transferase
MITVYVFGNAPAPVWGVTRDLRAVWALEESGLDYRLRPLDYFGGELKSAEYLGIQPFGQIPAIDDEGFRLFESAQIVLYAAERSGRLLPGDARGRALAGQWAFAAVNSVEPPLADLFVIDHFETDAARQRRPQVVEHAQARIAALERELARRPYLLGDAFAAPDILMSTVLRLAQHTDLLRAAPAVAAYQQRCEARPAWQKVIAAHQQRLAA